MKHAACLSASMLLIACETISPEAPTLSEFEPQPIQVPPSWGNTSANPNPVATRWVSKIQDPMLNALVQEAQRNNYDLKIAAMRVKQAHAIATRAGASLRPNITANAELEDGRDRRIDRDDFDRNAARIRVSWELDLWGRLQAGREAASSDLNAQEADFESARNSIAATVSQAYFVSIEAGIQVHVAEQSLEILSQINRIVRLQFDNQIVSSQDLALSDVDLAIARSTLDAAKKTQRDAIRAVEVLLGRYPSSLLQPGITLPRIPSGPPVGIPSSILERRPDIIAAEKRVASASARLKQAKAAKLPQLILTSDIGASSTQISNLLNSGNLAWTIGSGFVAPLIDNGRRRASINDQMARRQQAEAAYFQVVLSAFREVEEALDSWQTLSAREQYLLHAERRSREALEMAQLLYNEGEIDLIDVLTIQQRVFFAQRDLVNVQRRRLEQWVGLNLALGGSWN